jgi:glycosyltransferase involved in cell wall biosynthesis
MPYNKPLISVIMPAYNAGAYLAEAIESILNQTCGDFELLLLDDGSTDNTREIATSYQDKRIRYLPNKLNLKLVATLNRGLDLARGHYIARMDADDVSLPQRFEKQVKFLEENEDVVCVGTGMRTLGLDNDYDILYDSRSEVVKVLLLFSCKIAHATVLLKHDLLRRYPIRFNNAYLHVEDFDFFYRLSRIGKVCSIPEILYLRRFHQHQVCIKERQHQIQTERKLRKKILQELFPQVFDSVEKFNIAERYFVEQKQPTSLNELMHALQFFSTWLNFPNEKEAPPSVLFPMLAKRCWDMCTNAPFTVKGLSRSYERMGFIKWFNPGLANRFKLRLRDILN